MSEVNAPLSWVGEPVIDRVRWTYDAYVLDENDPTFQSMKRLDMDMQQAVAYRYLRYLYDEVHVRGFTLFQSWSGRHRSGKSLTSAAFGYILDETFYDRMEHRIIKSHEEFFDEVEWIMKTKTKGAYISIDEGGVSMASSDWQEKWARDLAKALQMIGWLLPMFSISAPSRDFVQSKVRKLIHIHNAVKRSGNTKTSIYPYHLFTSDITGKLYTPYPSLKLCGQNYTIGRIQVCKPPKFLVKKYEEIANPQKEEKMKDFVDRSRDRLTEKMRKDVGLNLDTASKIVASNPEAFRSFSASQNKLILSLDLIRAYEPFNALAENGVSPFDAKIIREKAMKIIRYQEKINKEKS